jgi:hypothetical protein
MSSLCYRSRSFLLLHCASDAYKRTIIAAIWVSILLVSYESFVRHLTHLPSFFSGQVVCCTPGGRQRDIQSPRGIEGYYLLGENANPDVPQFTGWKVQGNFGGENYPDRTRKIFNEGGLYGEVRGACYLSYLSRLTKPAVAYGLPPTGV